MPHVVAPEGGIAAEVLGVTGSGASGEPDRAVVDCIRRTLHSHPVVVVRGLALSPDGQMAFTRAFGEPDVHAAINAGTDRPLVHTVSNLDEEGRPRAARLGSRAWHSDKSYRLIPSHLTFLHAVQLPPDGTSTSFADMAGAFDALEPSERERVSRLKVVHCWSSSLARSTGAPLDVAERRRWPPVAHPLARRRPDGRRALFMGQHASHILGQPREDGERLLARLLEHATAKRFVHRHRWQAGDLLIWDNAAVLHRAEADFDADRWARVLHRTVTRGVRAPD